MSKTYTTKGRTFEAETERKRRRFNRAKAQSGAMADARLSAVAAREFCAANDNTITAEQRARLRAEAAREKRRAQRQANCAKYRRLDVLWHDDHTFEVKVARKYDCNVPTCESCNERRSRVLLQRLIAAHARALERVPGAQVLELVLTQPSQSFESLGQQIDALHKGVRALLRTEDFKRALAGSFRRTEIAFNRDKGTTHAHCHMILYAWPDYFTGPTYLSHQRVQELWARIIGVDGFVNVHIKKLAKSDAPGALNRALLHAAKYILKPASVFAAAEITPDNDNPTYTIAPEIADAFGRGLFRKRMYAFHGCLRSDWKRPKRF